MNRKTVLALGAALTALIGVIVLTLYLLQSQQDVRSRASEENTSAVTQQSSCPILPQVQGVLVEFPNCAGDICNFTQASCSWNSLSGATAYQVKISQVESGEIIKNDQVASTVTRIEFPIVQNKTYKCEVAGINSCGASGVAGSHSLLCAVDAIVSTPTPQPTIPPAPTLTPTSTPTPQPTIPPAGGFNTSITVGLGTIMLILTGIALLIL